MKSMLAASRPIINTFGFIRAFSAALTIVELGRQSSLPSIRWTVPSSRSDHDSIRQDDSIRHDNSSRTVAATRRRVVELRSAASAVRVPQRPLDYAQGAPI